MINIKSKYKIYRNLNTHCLFKSQMLWDRNEPNTSPCKKSLFLFYYPVQWFQTCIPWSPAEAFCILAISSTGSKISVTCSATHEKSWNTPKSLTASNLFFSGIQQTVSGIPVVIYMQLKKSISKFLSFCNNSTRVIFISHIKISPKGNAVCLPLWSLL